MLGAVVIIALLHLASSGADDPFDEEPYYLEGRPSFRNPEHFLRFTRRHDAFLPEEDDLELDFSEDFVGARPTRSHDKSDNFVRFGRGNSDFVRFGRDPYKYKDQNFVRFGRSVPKKRSKRDAEEKKRNGQDDFLRFGRAGDDSFIRYGRNMGSPLPTKAHPAWVGRVHSPLLDILRKIEEDIRMREDN